MKADILTLKALFQKDIRYVIPTFQRPYVWNQEDQWEPLWNDVRNIAERYQEELEQAGGQGKEAQAEERTGSHFMGAVVLQQQPTSTAELDTRLVIDGQQRLTTLQLLLDAAQEVFEDDGLAREARLIRRLVLNDADVSDTTDGSRFKIWPTLLDREAFRHAMANDLLVDGHADSPIVQAHEFFKLQIREWLTADPAEAAVRAPSLATALMGLLHVVVIDLQTADDANVIFETLNARGTPLLASDLVKNSVLHSAREEGLDADDVYKRWWQDFDSGWWREEIGQGRIVRPRIDVYLNYWLSMRTGAEVASSEVFSAFRKHLDSGSLTAVVGDLRDVGASFRRLTTLAGTSREATFLYRWRVMDAGVSTPLLLWLYSSRGELGDAAFQESLDVLESYLVRRMVCRMTTKDYNRLFLELLKTVEGHAGSSVPAVMRQYLCAQSADARLWPIDTAFTDAIESLPLYWLLTRGRLRLVLEALEDAMRSPKSEVEHVPRGKLTIEHVMPQGWRTHWPLPTGAADPELASAARDRAVQTLGNLTLVTKWLNPALSNSPWATKREALADHSVLHLNKRLLSSAGDDWNEEAISARSRDLAEIACRIWPRSG